MPAPWRRFVILFGAAAIGTLLAAAATIALLDPLAVSPLRVVSDEILPQTNRRYLVPVIVRGHRYDSYIVGTSSIHSLDPKRFDELMPGRFANLSLFASTPFEQAQVIRLVARESSGVRTIIWGLDVNWCNLPPLPRYSGLSEFPDWLYDDDRWNDLLHAFNWSSLDLARRKLQQVFRPKAGRLRADGYLNMMPPEATYDVARIRETLRARPPQRPLVALAAPTVEGSAEAGAALPGVAILEEVVAALPSSARVLYVLMPAHASLLPPPGSADDKRVEDCKAAIAAIARRRGDWVIDAMWHSAWTVEDTNFWDPQHFRDRLAEGMIDGIGSAVAGVSMAPHIAMRVLARGR